MDGERSTDLQYCTLEDIPTCLRFCLRFLGLWAGNEAYRNGRSSINSRISFKDDHNTIALEELASDISEERQALLTNPSGRPRTLGKYSKFQIILL